MIKNIFNAVFISLFFFSCSDNYEKEIMKNAPQTALSSYKVTPEEAQEVILNFMDAMEDSKQTRSVGEYSSKEIANVKALRRGTFKTRSGYENRNIPIDLDTLMYVVNFSDNNGFALVAADKRTDPIFAIIDEGNYDFEELDEEENESFLSFVDGAIATELEDINQYQGNEATRSVINGWDIIIICYPILKTKWSQGGYNNPNSYGKYCPNKVTGCTVTATAQLLSHFKTMEHVDWSYNGTSGSTNLNWRRIISDCGKYNGSLSPTSTLQSMDEIAHLCRYLGIAFGAKYNVDKKNKNKNSTGVGEDKPIDWFDKWGGLKATKLKKYDETSIINAIRLGPPVYAQGNSGKKKFLFVRIKYTGGHAWIYDGCITATKNGKRQNLIHCNWGWGGSRNGYYLSNVFKANVGPEINDFGTRSAQENYYQYNLEYSLITR